MNLFETKSAYQAGALTKAQYIDEMHVIHRGLFEYADLLAATDIARIELTDHQVVMESRTSGIKIICDRVNKRLAPLEILNFGAYEKTDSAMMFRLIRPGSTVLDIGANVGWYALNIARLSDARQVLAFEPVQTTFTALQANVELNQLRNVVAYNLGFSDHAGEAVFYCPPGGSDNASAANLSEREDVQTTHCQLMTLDEFVTAHQVSVDFIKCDVEGAELFVFRGALETLQRWHPIILAEMLRKWSAKFNYHPNEIIELLAGLGYCCFTAKADRLVEFDQMDNATLETNFFFLHTEQHAAEISQWL
jgi:FkbM family methyltransferase